MLRTRVSGSDSLVDVHIMVDPMLSVSEGHQIGEAVRLRLVAELEHVSDVTVHIDPEDDEAGSPSNRLPLRAEVMQRLQQEWEGLGLEQYLDHVVLHYLSGKIQVEVFLQATGARMEQALGLADAVRARARQVADIGSVQVYVSETDAQK
jgi:DNA-binding protein